MSTKRRKMKTMKSGERSPAFCLLIQLGHMPRNVAISMITIPILSLSVSLALAEKRRSSSEGGKGLVGREDWRLCIRRISVLLACLSRSKEDIH